jgi:sugar phosphate permease
MLISSHWYTKPEAAPRFSIWYAGLGVGQIVGGIVSYGFQQVHKDSSFAGWKIMFVALGVVTVIIGFTTILVLPDTPMQARFLSEPEKVALLKHVAINQTGIENKHIKIKHILEILTDVQLWLLVLLTILVSGLAQSPTLFQH